MIYSAKNLSNKVLIAVLAMGLFGLMSAGVLASEVELHSEPIVLVPHLASGSNTACTIKNHSDTAMSFFRFFVAGDRIAAYMNPAACSSPQYPFEVQSVSLTLYGGFGANWPVEVAIEIWSAAVGDSCGGPVSLEYSETFSLDLATYGIPNVGTAMFSSPVCVTGPFFVAIRYTGATPAPFPSVNFDNHMPGDTCANWAFESGNTWEKWNQFWSSPFPGAPLFWAEGQTQSSSCSPAVCCIGTTGNVNKGVSETPDLSDLSLLIAYLIQSPRPQLPCLAEANINVSVALNPDLSDLSLLIAYLTTLPRPTLPNCP